MELRHLRYFVAVAEELHFGRAAERLCIAQPPLSRQIQDLERELGFRLFDRTNRRVELTAAGRVFLDDARETLATLDRSVRSARRVASGEAGWLGIGFVGSAAYEALPAVVRSFRRRYPDVALALRELVSARQADALRERRIHVGLARPSLAEPGLAAETLLREPFVAALPEDHRLSTRSPLPLSELAREPFVLFPRHPKPSYADTVVAASEAAGFEPQVVQEAAEMHTAISLVSAGVGVTLVPASVARGHPRGVAFRLLDEPCPLTELALVYREDDSSPVLREFLQTAWEAVRAEG